MALKVCNKCGVRGFSGDECPVCLANGEGSIRDYHYIHEEDATPSPEVASVASAEGDGDKESTTEDPSEDEQEWDSEHPYDGEVLDREDLEQHSRNRLSQMARERSLDPSGTKADLIARLLGDGQG